MREPTVRKLPGEQVTCWRGSGNVRRAELIACRCHLHIGAKRVERFRRTAPCISAVHHARIIAQGDPNMGQYSELADSEVLK